MQNSEQRRLHQNVDLLGLRAQATTVGLLALTTELVRSGAIDFKAVDRIKDAIAKELMLNPPSGVRRSEYEGWVRGRLDALFACDEPVGAAPNPPTGEHVA